MKNILVAGYYGYQNSGDDAILHSICDDILQLEIETEIMVLSNKPEVTKQEYPVESVYRFSFRAVWKAVRKCDVVVMGGGSLIQDMTSTRSLYYYLGILWMAKLFGKPAMLYGNGIGPIRKWYNKPFTRMTLNRINTITLREHLSKEMLNQLKISKPMIEVTADPVFNLNLKEEISIKELVEKEQIPMDKPFVVVLFRKWGDSDSYIRKMAAVCDQIVSRYQYNIVFIAMKYPNDLTISDMIRRKMKQPAYLIKAKYPEEMIISFMGQSRLIMSMRLHGLIYGAMKRVPLIGFNYDPKVEYYSKELDIPYVEDMRHIHVDKIMETIEEIELRRPEMIAKLETRVAELKIEAKRNREYLRALL